MFIQWEKNTEKQTTTTKTVAVAATAAAATMFAAGKVTQACHQKPLL